jgi:Protein of unknown function (DUF2281)
MNTVEKICELVKALPEEEASQVLVFAESLQDKTKVQSDQDVAAQEKPQLTGLLSDFAGILKGSPNFNEDPVEIQRKMRDEWS